MNPAARRLPRVLLIEDDPTIRQEIVDLLVEEGYLVDTAENGKEGLARLRTTAPPCVILLDLMMPVMDGWTFRAEQLKESDLARIPVVVISGAGISLHQTAGLGVTAYLAKPFSIQKLLITLASCCPP